MADNIPRFMVEDALFNFRNFSGRNSRFATADLKQNFGVILSRELAEQLLRDGWPVKFPDPREEGEERDPYITVHLGYKIRPPRVVMITSVGKVALDQDTVEVLDWADIQSASLIANQGFWEMNGKSGYKAWLKTLVVTIEEDELERKYGLNETMVSAVPEELLVGVVPGE